MQIHVSNVADPMLFRELRIGEVFVMHEAAFTGAVFMKSALGEIPTEPGLLWAFIAVVIGARGIGESDERYIAPGALFALTGDEPVTPLRQLEPLALKAATPHDREPKIF